MAAPSGSVATPIQKIDTFIEKQRGEFPIRFIKVDVQGYELPVCKGMERTLAGSPHAILEITFVQKNRKPRKRAGPKPHPAIVIFVTANRYWSNVLIGVSVRFTGTGLDWFLCRAEGLPAQLFQSDPKKNNEECIDLKAVAGCLRSWKGSSKPLSGR